MGIVLPIIGWSDQRRKSNYASFHSLQALGYQSLGFTVWILSYLAAIILASIILLVILGPAGRDSGSMDAGLRPWIVIIVVLLLGLFALYFILPIIAVVACALGRDFRYPILGDRLARYLEYDPTPKPEERIGLNEAHEFHWVAAMGHFSILILLWGMLAPLTTWILFGRRDSFLKFQSIQTLVYQAVTTILSFVALLFYMLGLLLLVAGMQAVGAPDSPGAIFGIVILGAFLLVSSVVILLIPLLHILGQWAGYRLLKGDNYRYPLVGRLVDRWSSENPTIEEN